MNMRSVYRLRKSIRWQYIISRARIAFYHMYNKIHKVYLFIFSTSTIKKFFLSILTWHESKIDRPHPRRSRLSVENLSVLTGRVRGKGRTSTNGSKSQAQADREHLGSKGHRDFRAQRLIYEWQEVEAFSWLYTHRFNELLKTAQMGSG